MIYLDQIKAYKPQNQQEKTDLDIIFNLIDIFGDKLLFRENKAAHFTASAFILNENLTKVLMINHKIMSFWAWPGGHTDGEKDFFKVSKKEALEETGALALTPLFGNNIASLDILPVTSHTKNGVYVNAHLHLSAAYIFSCAQNTALKPCAKETDGLNWIDVEQFNTQAFNKTDRCLYSKLLQKAQNAKPK